MESDPEKADRNKSLWEEVKVTGVNLIYLDSIFMSFRFSNNPTYLNLKSNEFSLNNDIIVNFRELTFVWHSPSGQEPSVPHFNMVTTPEFSTLHKNSSRKGLADATQPS